MKLVTSFNPILRTQTRTLDLTEIPDLRPVFEHMHETMHVNNGIGLSAAQVGLDFSVFVMNCMGNKRTCINPEILQTGSEIEVLAEGCLSFPNLKLPVARPFSIIAKWIDEQGYEHVETLMGLEARCFLHEWDHCQGICFTDRVGAVTLHLAKKKSRLAEKKARRLK